MSILPRMTSSTLRLWPNWHTNLLNTGLIIKDDSVTKRAISNATSGSIAHSDFSRDATRPPSVASSEKSSNSSYSLERYLEEQEEAVSPTAIVSNAHLLGVPTSPSRSPRSLFGHNLDNIGYLHSGPPSVGSRGPLSSNESWGSQSSISRPSQSRTNRQGVRKRPRTSASSLHSNSARSSASYKSGDIPAGIQPISATLFFCVVCSQEFKSFSEWKRHEESVEFQAWEWVCCLGMETFPSGNCIFCMAKQVDSSHMISKHQFFRCCGKLEMDHMPFSRKDHLREHIRRKHHTDKDTEPPALNIMLNNWRRPNPKINQDALRCGFCGLVFAIGKWDQRCEHVANHFKQGLNMSAWWASRQNNEFRHDSNLLRGPHLSYTDPKGSFVQVCQCCPDMVHHIASHDMAWSQPCQCCCCKKVFPSWDTAQQHQLCTYWSCSFLPSIEMAFYGYEDGILSCCFCGDDMGRDQREGAWRSPDERKQHLEVHNFRGCEQEKFFSFEAFQTHLIVEHRLTQGPDDIGLMSLRTACCKTARSTFQPYVALTSSLQMKSSARPKRVRGRTWKRIAENFNGAFGGKE
ncbi:hypothetical protein EJ08DRAFT_278732 [Tothia fuscella]|uniref:C2H2-type domain-containing protein n=1 Tax=Tothia fuscella TaxID=1048955 RepID=A0A9P4NQG8_9PEZI|nr:hypothetical protein EJ08DRAFT_278732 [Tothia fuscella]